LYVNNRDEKLMKLAGVIVLYNPDTLVIDNILSYIDDVDILYAVDNSSNINSKVINRIKQIKKIAYVYNGGNKGIAYAQNVAAKEAIKENYKWLLTMDQDSFASKNSIAMLKEYIEISDTGKIGIVSTFQETEIDKSRNHSANLRKVPWVISSGNIINLEIFQNVGGFLQKLFIDAVDYEYCLRLHSYGYSIHMLNKAVIKHKLGETKKVGNQYMYIHDYRRMYFRVRNTFYIRKKYKKSCPDLSKNIFDMSLITWQQDLRYGKRRLKQLLYMCLGYFDFLINNFNNNILR
jgi:rhamnosyltransferase